MYKANEIVTPNRENWWFVVSQVPFVFEYTIDRIHWNTIDIKEDYINNVVGMTSGVSVRLSVDWKITSR